MKHIGRVNVFQPSEDLIEKIADVIIAELLGLQQLVEISFHQILYYVSAEKHSAPSRRREAKAAVKENSTVCGRLHLWANILGVCNQVNQDITQSPHTVLTPGVQSQPTQRELNTIFYCL